MNEPKDTDMPEVGEKDIEGTDMLYRSVRRMCSGLTVPSIGTALTAVLVDFAMHIDMSKEELLEIVSGTWDSIMEDEVKH